jgi:hypothetical protein
MTGLDADATRRVTQIIAGRGEPLPIDTLARRFFEDEEARALLAYTPDRSFLVGERVVWETRSYGRLIGEVTGVEHVDGNWRMLVDWDDRLSPSLPHYHKARDGIRLAYLMDPAGQRPRVVSQNGEGSAGSVAQLLAWDLEDDLRSTDGFVEWAGLWSPASLLPSIAEKDFETAAAEAIEDDGVAHTNEVLALLGLPGPDEHGHGFAAVAVNLRMRSRSTWFWGGPREGGQWLPRRVLDAVRLGVGAPPRFEELAIGSIPRIPDMALPDDLAEMIATATVRGLGVAAETEPLRHVVSDWERERQVLTFDELEFSSFPDQAAVRLVIGGREVAAHLISEGRLLAPADLEARSAISQASAATLGRVGASDVFTVELDRSQKPGGAGEFDLLRVVLAVFADGGTRRPEDVVDAVLLRYPGDVAVVSRAVAALLAGYECFEAKSTGEWSYRADLPHRAKSGPTTTIAAVARQAIRSREEAIREERAMRRWKADAIRSPHLVRGHFRRLRKSISANPVQVLLARRYGMTVPRGHTFVRPHERTH